MMAVPTYGSMSRIDASPNGRSGVDKGNSRRGGAGHWPVHAELPGSATISHSRSGLGSSTICRLSAAALLIGEPKVEWPAWYAS